MPNEITASASGKDKYLDDEDRKGLLLGSLASGVLSAIVGARSGNVDPVAAGLAGAGQGYGGGYKQITDLRAAAQAQEDKKRSLAVSEAAQQESERYNKYRGEYYKTSSDAMVQQRNETVAKMKMEEEKLTEALRQGKIDRQQHAEGMKRLYEAYAPVSERPETEQEAMSGQMPSMVDRTPSPNELVRIAAQYPTTGKYIESLLKPINAEKAASEKQTGKEVLQAATGVQQKDMESLKQTGRVAAVEKKVITDATKAEKDLAGKKELATVKADEAIRTQEEKPVQAKGAAALVEAIQKFRAGNVPQGGVPSPSGKGEPSESVAREYFKKYGTKDKAMKAWADDQKKANNK
jgi:hypothetical protein